MQRAHLVAAEWATRNHALNGLFEHAFGKAALEHLARGDLLDAAGVAGVFVINLLLELAAGEADLLGVDDHHMVAAVDVRREARLVLAAQDIGDDRREPANDQPVGIDQMPFLLDLGRLRRPGRLHQRLHGPNLIANEKGGASVRRRRMRYLRPDTTKSSKSGALLTGKIIPC